MGSLGDIYIYIQCATHFPFTIFHFWFFAEGGCRFVSVYIYIYVYIFGRIWESCVDINILLFHSEIIQPKRKMEYRLGSLQHTYVRYMFLRSFVFLSISWK